MSQAESLEKSLEALRKIGARTNSICAVEHFPAKEGIYKDYPPDVHPALLRGLEEKGFSQLYIHQYQAWENVQKGKNVVVVTPTASGKTLCYNLPTLDAILKDSTSRAIYLFPTKALSQDQRSELDLTIKLLPGEVRVFTYDGDTPQDARKAIRARGHIILTNPDMLHTGILPHHTKWIKLFENLKFVVIDELHTISESFAD